MELNLKQKFLPVSKPLITKTDISAVNKVLKNGWISSEGPQVKKFENLFSKYIKMKYSVAVSNGTAALEIAVKSLNLKKNDEIIIPDFTIISNALAAIKNGNKIITIDCDKYDWNMKIDEIIKKINKNTKVIIATHIYNYPLNIHKLKNICRKKKIHLIEDAAEVLGQKIGKKLCGSFGDISTFSFYANKQITTGEGGMICTNNYKYYKKILSLRNLCFGKINRYNHEDIGWNYRITNIQAALGISQLKRINSIVKRREYIGAYYHEKLKDNQNIYIPPPTKNNIKNIYWVVGIVIVNTKLKIDAKKLMKLLNIHGINTRAFFWPMHKQKILLKKKLVRNQVHKNSKFLSKYGLYLPNYLNIRDKDIDFICSVLNKITK
jgi:perosamine synthetase